MFGWLSARSASHCRRAPPAVESRRTRRITPQALVSRLPSLGSVLYVHAHSPNPMLDALPQGLLITQRAFAPLLDAHWLVAISMVTDDGPREWCECVDRFGRTGARWHLLPDTDYLAWDALTASCKEPSTSIDKQPLRPYRASVMNFRLRELAGLLILDQDVPAMLSPLSDRIAARIARAESAELHL
jgi:hypothetical protein